MFTSAAAGAAGISLSPGDALRPVTYRRLSLITSANQIERQRRDHLALRGTPTSNIFKGPRITNVGRLPASQ